MRSPTRTTSIRNSTSHSIPGHVRPMLFIGPSRLGGPLLEVMVEITPPRDLVVFHVMVARAKHLARMEGMNDED